MTRPDANTQNLLPAVTTHPFLGVGGSSLLLATCCAACLLVVSFRSKVPTQYRQVTAALVEAK